MILPLGLKLSFVSLNAFVFLKYNIDMIAVVICPMIVAIAAPVTPMFNANIAIGSKIILIIAPITVAIIEYFGEPSALIAPLRLVVKM